jgi:hypothetical protein
MEHRRASKFDAKKRKPIGYPGPASFSLNIKIIFDGIQWTKYDRDTHKTKQVETFDVRSLRAFS